MKLQLPANILSPQDVKAISTEIQNYADWFARAEIKKRAGGNASGETPVLSEAAISLLKDWTKGKPISLDGLEELAKALNDFEAGANIVTITLAAPASNGLKQTLVTWCRTNIGPDVLISFRFNSTLLGGIVIRYGSHIFDYSFKRQLLSNRQKFPEVLRRV